MCLFPGSVYQQHGYILYLLFVPHSTALRLPSEIPINITPFFFFPFSFTFMKVFVPFYFTKRSHMTLTYVHLQNEPITILKLSRMHDVRGSLHTDVLWYYLDCNSKRQANGFAAPTEPVPTHQRYHSDFSSSSESPSVTSSDPDYGQGRRTEWNIYHSTWLLKERKGCIPLRKLNVCIWYEGWCLRTAWL